MGGVLSSSIQDLDVSFRSWKHLKRCYVACQLCLQMNAKFSLALPAGADSLKAGLRLLQQSNVSLTPAS